MNKVIRKFIGFHGIPYICSDKNEGGMGFRTMKEFDLAMLAKKKWHIIRNEGSFCSVVA